MTQTKDLVIGIDVSTTACKAIAWDRRGKPVAEGRASYELLSPHPNWYEQRADDWWEALCRVLRELLAQVGADRFAALCIAHQRESFVPVDEHNQPIRNALLWLDDRSQAQVAELDQRVGSDVIQQLTGKGPSTNPSLPKLLWLQENEPGVMKRAYKIQDTHGFLAHQLTGQWATSLPSADPMGVVDMRRGTWAIDLMGTLGIDPSLFVEIVPPGRVIGELTPAAAALTGLWAGLPIIAGCGDGQSAGLGANITGPGRVYLNLGTAVVSGAHSATYIANRAFRTLCSPIAGAFVLESVIRAGTFIVSWFVEQFGADLRRINLPLSPEELLEAAASKLPPGSSGLMLVPYWGAVMTPYWDTAATGIMIGWTGAHRREHFYRAILEGIAYEHRLAMESIAAATGQPIHEFIVMGGGSRSALWCQIIADVTGKRVIRAGSAEATNLGAGILAAAAAGWYPDVYGAANAMTTTGQRFEPNFAAHAIYDRLFDEVYRGIFPVMRASVDRLTALTQQNPGAEIP